MSGQNRAARRRKGLPKGMTYADELYRQRMIREAVKASADDARVKVETDIRCQRQLWLCCVAMNEAFGIGPDRFKKFAEVLTSIAEEYDAMTTENGADYANEKLRQRAEQISGIKIDYLYEHEMAEARRRNEAKGVHFEDGDQSGASIADAIMGGTQ